MARKKVLEVTPSREDLIKDLYKFLDEKRESARLTDFAGDKFGVVAIEEFLNKIGEPNVSD